MTDGSKLRTTIAMASSATLLCWGGYAFKDGYQQSEHLEHLQNILVQPGTYFLTMWQGIREVVIKVSDTGPSWSSYNYMVPPVNFR